MPERDQMADQIADRATRLFDAKKHELREKRDGRAAVLTAEFNKRGMFHSGNRLSALQNLYASELREAAGTAWEVLCKAHAAMGSEVSDAVRASLRTWMRDCVESLRRELSGECNRELRGADPRGIEPSLRGPADIELQRYDAEIDNYLDMTKNQPKGGGSYNRIWCTAMS